MSKEEENINEELNYESSLNEQDNLTVVEPLERDSTGNETKYDLLLSAFNKLANSYHFDPDFLRNIKEEAGIL